MFFFFFNDTATTEIYTLSLHDALPISLSGRIVVRAAGWQRGGTAVQRGKFESVTGDIRFDGEVGRGGGVELERSEEHTSELPSQSKIGCRLLLGKKKTSGASTRRPTSP